MQNMQAQFQNYLVLNVLYTLYDITDEFYLYSHVCIVHHYIEKKNGLQILLRWEIAMQHY